LPPLLLSLELFEPTAPGFYTVVASASSNTAPEGELRPTPVDSAEVDALVLVLLGGAIAVAAAVWLLGRYYPGSGAEQLGLRSGREITETREALEAEDLDQMLAAHNARRRARGEQELTIEHLMGSVKTSGRAHRLDGLETGDSTER
jgi:hypothetical protein